jgi:hypothetical protein
MRLALCLMLLAVAGAYLVAQPHLFASRNLAQIVSETSAQTLWDGTVKSFFFPLALFLMGLTRSRLVKVVDFGFGTYLALLTAWVLIQPGHTAKAPYQTPLMVVVMILGAAIALFSLMTLTQKKLKAKNPKIQSGPQQ